MILESDAESQSHFQSDLDWLKKRRLQWKNSKFRVGLMGVTSSGKSTLVNALLDERLLPQAVRPSSNCLVVCEWGEQAEGIVHFLDSLRRPELTRGKALRRVLRRYADETTNPGNIEGVREIELRSPAFLLDRGVSIVDTPGLDAYGHDDHEKLTLEVLLPTVDVVLFVTTCKANSDAKVNEYVNLARDLNKSVIVVQNMMDSVVEKIGSQGQVLKSREQVLTEHRRRVQAVLGRTQGECVHINQVSAQWALNGQRDRSGIDTLVKDVHHQLKMRLPAIDKDRLQQVRNRLQKSINNEQRSDKPSVLRKMYQADLIQLQEQAAVRTNGYKAMMRRLGKAQKDADSQASEFFGSAAGLGKRNVVEAHALKNEIENWLRASPAELSQWNKDLMVKIRQDCEELNLSLDDLDLGAHSWRTASSIRLNTSEKSTTRQVEQSGWWASIKRKVDVFDADWGYDDKPDHWSEIADLDLFRSGVRSAVEHELSQVAQFIEQAMLRAEKVQTRMSDEVEQQQRAIHEKMDSAAKIAQRLVNVRRLEVLIGIAQAEPQNQTFDQDSSLKVESVIPALVAPAMHEINVPTLAVHLCQLSTLISRRRFLALREVVMQRAALRRKVNVKRVLIAGFDSESINDFVNRFWFDRLQANDSSSTEPFTKIAFTDEYIDEIGLVCLSGSSQDPRHKVKNFLQMPATLFLLLDIQQIGATASQLVRSHIDINGDHGATIVVIQSIHELENSDSIAEALLELKKLLNQHGIKPVGVLVNDDEVVHTQVAARLLERSTPRQTLTDDAEFMRSLPKRFRQRASDTIRSWNDLNT